MAAEIHKGDIGTRFLITIKDEDGIAKPIGSYTTKQFIFEKPSGNLVTKTASFYTDGSDGKLYYTTLSGDLDEEGAWKLQVYIHDGSTNYRKSNVGTFRVHSNLE